MKTRGVLSTLKSCSSLRFVLDHLSLMLSRASVLKSHQKLVQYIHLCNSFLVSVTVLTRAKRFAFFMPTLPCLVSFCKAFPPLFDDVMSLLVQVGQVSAADVTTKARDIDPLIASECVLVLFDLIVFKFCNVQWLFYVAWIGQD